ncbi:MAG: hypothetical protein WC821_02025 [archaeon]|jgi:hypothetical protein
MVEAIDPTKKIVHEAEEWAAKQKLLQMSEISLVLDSYDDIFSDFDPRTLDKRALSDDLMIEIRKATREKKSGVIEVNFLIPLEQQKAEKEAAIKKRLREHFRKHYEQVEKEVKEVRNIGMVMVVIGLILSVIAAVFVYPNESNNIWNNIILVLIEPAAWFAIWEGANRVLYTWKSLQPDLEFYKKMMKSEISFTAY